MTARERSTTVILVAVAVLGLGSAGAVLDVVFAGCVASGPCIPVPPLPLLLPLAVVIAGAGLLGYGIRTRPGGEVPKARS